jgi:chemotaxis family two-component system response regulator Rcp1
MRAEILLVEDNPADIRLFKEALKSHGSSVDLSVAMTGEEAISRLRREGMYAGSSRPDFVVLDMSLPGKSGREVLAEMKSDPDLCCVPVVVFSLSGNESDINAAYDLHANCYIRKPVDVAEYMEAIARCEIFWLSVVRLPYR